jgi:hypothetical protein
VALLIYLTKEELKGKTWDELLLMAKELWNSPHSPRNPKYSIETMKQAYREINRRQNKERPIRYRIRRLSDWLHYNLYYKYTKTCKKELKDISDSAYAARKRIIGK